MQPNIPVNTDLCEPGSTRVAPGYVGRWSSTNQVTPCITSL